MQFFLRVQPAWGRNRQHGKEHSKVYVVVPCCLAKLAGERKREAEMLLYGLELLAGKEQLLRVRSSFP